jgi:hypothetical protein
VSRNIKDCPARDIARTRGERFYIPEVPCRNGHLSKRYTIGGAWVECQRQHQASYKTGALLGAFSEEEIANSVQTSVYVISAGEYVKVGIAEDVGKRLATIQSQCPLLLSVAGVFGPMPRLEARRIEQQCFRLMFGRHERGEWYRCSAHEILSIISGLGECKPSSTSGPQLRLVA